VLQLRSGIGLVPQLEPAIDALAAAGLVPFGIVAAHRLLTRMLVTLRLVCPESGDPPPASRLVVARACRHEDWDALVAAHDAARAEVVALWREVSAPAAGGVG
jgi:glutamate-ammonia-ligase adenylyltransferase